MTTTTTTRHPAAAPSGDDDDGGDVRDLVPSWLKSANLGYAIENFEMAGILTPRSFAELELRYFEPLGVTNGDDRKRLFYLIQRVRGELRREDETMAASAVNVGANGATTRTTAKSKSTRASDEGRRKRERGGRKDDDDDGDDHGGNDSGVEYQPPSDSVLDTVGMDDGTMEVISPVTFSSPIASSSVSHDNHHYDGLPRHCHIVHGDDEDDDGERIVIASKNKSSPSEVGRSLGHTADLDDGVDMNNGTVDAGETGRVSTRNSPSGVVSHRSKTASRGGKTSKMSAREQLQRELQLRAERRREMKTMMLSTTRDDATNDAYGSRSLGSRSSRRRQSYLPSITNGAFHADVEGGRGAATATAGTEVTAIVERPPSSSRPTSNVVAAPPHHRPPPASVATEMTARAGALGNDRGTATARAIMRGTNRAYPVLDDAESAMSDTSDLSASVFSNDRSSSLGVRSRSSSIGGGTSSGSRRRSSIPSASYIGPAPAAAAAASHRPSSSSSSLSGRMYGNIDAPERAGSGHADENRNHVNFDEERTRTIPTTKNGGVFVRDGKKRLSTIPSSSIAPLSPLKGFSSTLHDRSLTTAASSVGPCNPLRRGSRSSLGGGSDGASVGGCGSRSAPSSSPRPGSVAASESKNERRVNVTSSGTPPGTATTLGSSNRLLRPSSQSSTDGSRRFDVHDRLDASSSPSGTKTLASVSAASVQHQLQRLKSPKPMSSHGSIAGGGGGRVSPLPPKGRERATSPTRSILSARSNRPVSPMSTTQHQHPSLSPPKTGVVHGHNKGSLLSPMRSNTRSKTPPPAGFAGSTKGNSNATTKGAMFVHGALDDTSWGTQIGRLRESFDLEHAQYLTSTARLRRQQLSDEDDLDYDMRIRVIVRKRPLSNRESTEDVDAVQTLDYDDHGRILVHQPKTKLDLTKEVETTSFSFDNVFDEKSNNESIYTDTVQSLIPGLFRGTWASVFAYGQTGSGKTFTMMGANSTGKRAGNHSENSINRANLGLYCLAAQDVFRIAEDPAYEDISIGVSLFEIYGGKLLDLLNARNSVRCLEDSHGKVCFPGLSEHPVSSAEELMDIIDAGALNRSTGTTSANADSSRSHAVLQLCLRKDVGRTKNKEHGRLTFIDLAGSERGADTSMACRTTRMEGAEINTSLLALKEVIRALATGGSLKRIPFRGSKLTQVLKESFVGKNSRTVMVACVAPNMKNCDHSLNTLRYADRVKERDPQTGELSASVAASSKIKRDRADDMVRVKLPPPRPLTAPAASFRIIKEEAWSDDHAIPPPPSQEKHLFQSFDESKLVNVDEYSDKDVNGADNAKIDFDDTVDSLEEALKSNTTLSLSHHHDSTIPRPSLLRDNPSAQALIATHKTIMSKMLQFLQHEMTLVNDTDINRDNIDEYLNELEHLSDQQLILLSTLRESLEGYNSKNSEHGNKAGTHDPSDNDDSFDLRD